MIGLLVLTGGALIVNERRNALVRAQSDVLIGVGQFIANLLGEEGATMGEPQPVLDEQLAQDFIFSLEMPEDHRVRIFNGLGHTVADSYILTDRIEQRQLADIRDRRGSEQDVQRAARELEQERAATQRTGEIRYGTRHIASGGRVVSVAIPISYVEAQLGVLIIEGGDVDAIIARQRIALLPFIVIAALVTLASSLLLNFVIARPVLRLARAADQVRLSRARSISLPDISRRDDELGDLSTSLETMTHVLSERMDAIERFAADVAHEIRNPLTSIRSAVETLEIIEDPKQRDKLLGILQQDVARLDRLITDISNASRLDAELSRDEPKAIELDRLIADIVALYDDGKPNRAPVIFEPPPKAMAVTGQEGPLGQVLRNLIDNARSFTTVGGRPKGQVRVSMRREGREVRVIVEDDGPGIPPDNLETVFERFYTSRPKAARMSGGAGNSGLGLSIARQITEAHGGRLWAENRLDEAGEVIGARFILALPARRA